MKLKRLRAANAEQVEGHIGQPEKKRLKEGLYQLCSYYQWYYVHNQMIQNKRSQLV